MSGLRVDNRQFQGQQVYGTLCHGCQSSSEQSSDFLELEVSLEVRFDKRQ